MITSGGSMFSLENRQQLEASFKDFASRPENKPLLEEHQKEEVTAALLLQEQAQQAALQQQVLQLDQHDIKLLAPVLRSPVLRQLLVSLSNDAAGPNSGITPANMLHSSSSSNTSSANGLQAWLSNPRVMQLLRKAAWALKHGQLNEQQLAQVLQQQLKVMREDQPGGTELAAGPHQAVLPSHMLVEALNEHLAERHAGNRAYKQQQYSKAHHHYMRALAVVNFVVGSNLDDQAEVDHNKAIVLMNLAALHMATQEWGAAVTCSDDVLKLPVSSEDACKAWLRRSKANLGRHEYQAALQDLITAAEIEPWNEDIPVLRSRILQAQRAAACTSDKLLAARMFGLA